MSKRLIVLCDGTWNKAENIDRGKRKPTNVMKMVRADLASSGVVGRTVAMPRQVVVM